MRRPPVSDPIQRLAKSGLGAACLWTGTLLLLGGVGLSFGRSEVAVPIRLAIIAGVGLIFVAGGVGRFVNPIWLVSPILFIDVLLWLRRGVDLGSDGLLVLTIAILVPIPFVLSAMLAKPNAAFRFLTDDVAWLLVALAAYLSITLLWSPNVEYGGNKLSDWALFALAPAGLILIASRLKPPSWTTFLWLGCAYCVVVLVNGVYENGRFVLHGSNPIWIGRAAMLVAAVAVWSRSSNRLARGIALPIALLLAWRTQSRGPWLSFAAAVVITMAAGYLFGSRHGWRKGSPLLKLGFVGLVGATLLTLSVVGNRPGIGRFEELRPSRRSYSESIAYRERVQTEAWSMFLQAPLIGKGLGALGGSGAIPEYPHNVELELLAETGLIGAALWSLFVLRVLMRIRRHALLLALFLQAVGYAHFSGDLALNYEYIVIGALAVGAAAVLDEQKRERESVPQQLARRAAVAP